MAAILVVDDDEAIRDTLYDLFESDHQCRAAETAEQALKWLEAEAFDVVLTDIAMPGMSGTDLLGLVRLHQPHTPVIVISGTTDRDRAERLIKMGAFDYLVKPFNLERVEASVERAVAHHRRMQGGR